MIKGWQAQEESQNNHFIRFAQLFQGNDGTKCFMQTMELGCNVEGSDKDFQLSLTCQWLCPRDVESKAPIHKLKFYGVQNGKSRFID